MTKVPALMAHEIEEIKLAESPPKRKMIVRPAAKSKATPAEQEEASKVEEENLKAE